MADEENKAPTTAIDVPTISPVGTPQKGGKNKDGFVKGQVVGQKEYYEAIAKQRLKK